MKNIRWAIGCFLLIILSIYICYIVALNNYTVDIAFVLTKCGILEKFEFTKENLVTNDDSDTKDAQENLDNTNITTTDNKAQRRTPGLSASKDLRKNMFEIEKDFFASKKIFLQNKGINIEYPYMQKFNSIIELLIKHGYDIDDIHDSFGGFCYNMHIPARVGHRFRRSESIKSGGAKALNPIRASGSVRRREVVLVL